MAVSVKSLMSSSMWVIWVEYAAPRQSAKWRTLVTSTSLFCFCRALHLWRLFSACFCSARSVCFGRQIATLRRTLLWSGFNPRGLSQHPGCVGEKVIYGTLMG